MSERPIRIQRRRTRGWKMPPNTVSVTRPRQWGNPFRVSDGACGHPDCDIGAHCPTTPEDAVAAFRSWITPDYTKRAQQELRGKNLACWFPIGAVCHADALLEIANS